MSEDNELTHLSGRIKELGEKSTQILIYLSFAITAVVLLLDSKQLEPTQKHAMRCALAFWVFAIFPVLVGILPLKEFVEWFRGDKLLWYRKIRNFKFLLLWIAILLIICGAIAFVRSIRARSSPNTQTLASAASKNWVQAARNWGWSGLSSWSDEAILRNLSTPIGFRAAFPEYGTWTDEQIRDIALQAPPIPYRGIPPGFKLDSPDGKIDLTSGLIPKDDWSTRSREPNVPQGWKQGMYSSSDIDSQ